MIKFFRKIRQNMLTDNKLGKYFKYALGEIILVVIGILIALGINNWNETRKEKSTERQILSNLHQEFNQNKQIIASIKEGAAISSNACHVLMDLLSKDFLTASAQNLDSLIYLTLEHAPFIPSNSVFREIIEAGNINLISDEVLRQKLFAWSTLTEHIQSTYLVFEKWIEDGYLPYLSKNISLKNMDQFSPMAWKEKSRFVSGYDVIFNDREFENTIDNTLYHHSKMGKLYDEVDGLISEIIVLAGE